MHADDTPNYETLADQELALAASATNPAVRIRHLNRAAYIATLSERSRAPHRPIDPPE